MALSITRMKRITNTVGLWTKFWRKGETDDDTGDAIMVISSKLKEVLGLRNAIP